MMAKVKAAGIAILVILLLMIFTGHSSSAANLAVGLLKGAVHAGQSIGDFFAKLSQDM